MGPIFFEFFSEIGYKVTTSDDMDFLLPKRIKEFDIIIDYTTERSITASQEHGLLKGIMGSPWGDTGDSKLYIGLHGATTSYKNSERILSMIGARFLTHPPIQEIDVVVEKKDHPIMDGVLDFRISDELYLQEYYPPFETLLSTKFQGLRIPLAWIKSYGRGIVFYLALGHGKSQIKNKCVQRILKNTLLYWITSKGKNG